MRNQEPSDISFRKPSARLVVFRLMVGMSLSLNRVDFIIMLLILLSHLIYHIGTSRGQIKRFAAWALDCSGCGAAVASGAAIEQL